MLAPLVIMVTIGLLPLPPRAMSAAILGTLATVVVTTVPPDWGRVPWSQKWITATPPSVPDPARALVLITGHEPLSYLIPFFPPELRFIRIHGGFNWPGFEETKFWTKMQRVVGEQQGPIYLLYNPNEIEFARKHLAEYGLALSDGECAKVP